MKYPKINSIYKRDQRTKKIIHGDYSTPEFEMLKDIEWEFIEKLDGMNIRVEWKNSGLTFYGRTDEAMIPSLLATKLGSLFSAEKFLEIFGDKDVFLFGEGIGKKIQEPMGSLYNANDNDFVLFDVFLNHHWLDRDSVEGLANKFGVPFAPIVGYGSLEAGVNLVRDGFNTLMKGASSSLMAEGLIVRPKYELYTSKKERITTKIKYKDFL